MARTSSSRFKTSSSPCSSSTLPTPAEHTLAVSARPSINCHFRNAVTSRVSSLGLQSLLSLRCCFGPTRSVHRQSVSFQNLESPFDPKLKMSSVSSPVCDTAPLHHLKSSPDHLELPESIDRQSIRFRRLQCPSRLYRPTVHYKSGSERPIDLLGLCRCWTTKRSPSRTDGHVLAERFTWKNT